MNLFLEILFLFFIPPCSCSSGKIISDSVNSKFIANTITGENPVRKLAIYLPPCYTESKKTVSRFVPLARSG